MASPFRTKEMTEKHLSYLRENKEDTTCALCNKEPIKIFKYWKIVENSFPYDLVSSVSHILVPLRHITEDELSRDETTEFLEIKRDYLRENYEYTIECMPKNMSIPGHFHIHTLVNLK